MTDLPVWGVSLGHTRCVVAAKTKAAARRAFDMSAYTFNLYVAETGNADDLRTARAKPGQVFCKPDDHRREGGWVEVDQWVVMLPKGAGETT